MLMDMDIDIDILSNKQANKQTKGKYEQTNTLKHSKTKITYTNPMEPVLWPIALAHGVCPEVTLP